MKQKFFLTASAGGVFLAGASVPALSALGMVSSPEQPHTPMKDSAGSADGGALAAGSIAPDSLPALPSHALPAEGALGLIGALAIAFIGSFVMLRRRSGGYPPDDPRPDPGYGRADKLRSSANGQLGHVPLSVDRRALLDVMAAATPDEKNPYITRKARLRRARMLLQHREHLQTQGEPFDWRTYKPMIGTEASIPITTEPPIRV